MFYSGTPVYGENFIDRTEKLSLFHNYIINKQHIMIKAPRRFGKTSLIMHLCYLHNYKKIYIDIKRASSLKYIAEYIIDKIYSFAGVKGIVSKAKQSIASLIRQLKPNLSIDLNIVELTLEFLEKQNKNELDESELFLHALELCENIARDRTLELKIIFDEFQDIVLISDKKILDKMRSIMQHHKHITYIFLGSIESIMNEIFTSKKSSFFHFARIQELGALDINELEKFCKIFFDNKKIKYDESLQELIIKLEGHPYYTMKSLQSLYFECLQNNKTKITKSECSIALTSAFYETKSYLEEILENLKLKKYHYLVLYNLANNKKEHNISSAVLYKTYKSLENMGYVVRLAKGNYIINDVFLKFYLQEYNEVNTT